MEHYEDKIDRALQYLKEPSRTDARGYAPIVYLIYPPEDVMVVRNIVKTFLGPKADYYGFSTFFISMGEMIDRYINNHEYREFWTEPDVEENAIYNSIKQEIESSGLFEKSILEKQDALSSEQRPLLVLQDLEMLHPFYMMGVIENKIYNKITVPTLVLYPGEAQGNARSFLSIYQHDGNYRSINF